MLRWAASTQDGVGTLGLDDVSHVMVARAKHEENLIRLTLAEVILRQVIEEARVILSDFRDFQYFFL